MVVVVDDIVDGGGGYGVCGVCDEEVGVSMDEVFVIWVIWSKWGCPFNGKKM